MLEEKRADCRGWQDKIAHLTSIESKTNEANGASKDELDCLCQFYPSYITTLETTEEYMSQVVTAVDVAAFRDCVTKQQQANLGLVQIRNYGTFVECNNRMERLTSVLAIVERWGRAKVEPHHFQQLKENIPNVFGGSVKNVTVDELATAHEGQPELFDACLNTAQADCLALDASSTALEQLQVLVPCDAGQLVVDAAQSLVTKIEAIDALLDERKVACIQGAPPEVLDTIDRVQSALLLLTSWLAVQRDLELLRPIMQCDATAKCVDNSPYEDAKAAAQAIGTAAEKDPTLTVLIAEPGAAAQVSAAASNAASSLDEIDNVCVNACRRCPRLNLLNQFDTLKLIGGTDVAQLHTCLPFFHTLFEGWSTIQLNEDGTHITMVVGEDNEILQLVEPVAAAGSMISWLPELQASVRNTISDQLQDIAARVNNVNSGLEAFDADVFSSQYCTQVGLVGLHLLWTNLVEGALGRVDTRETAERPGDNLLEHFGSSRPVSAASRPVSAAVRLTKITAPTSSNAVVEPRPGSASAKKKNTAAAVRPASGGEQRTAAAGLVSPSRSRSGWSRPATAGVPRPSVTNRLMSTQGVANKSSCTAKMRNVTTLLKAHLLGCPASQSRKLQCLVALQHRLTESWDQELKNLTDSGDSRWRREPRAYTKAGGKGTFLEIGFSTFNHQLEFKGKIDVFVVSHAHHELWMRFSNNMFLNAGSLVVAEPHGRVGTIKSLAVLCSAPCVVLEDPSARAVQQAMNAGMWIVLKNVDQMDTGTQATLAQTITEFLAGRSQELLYDSHQTQLFATATSLAKVHETFKTSLRCCHMLSLDLHFIAEVLLHMNAYSRSSDIAAKINTVRASLVASGSNATVSGLLNVRSLSQIVATASTLRLGSSSMKEEHSILHAMQMELLPHLAGSDYSGMVRLLNALFQSQSVSTFFPQLKNAALKHLSRTDCVCTPTLEANLLFLHQSVVERACQKPIVVTGPTGSGKSQLLKALKLVVQSLNDAPNPTIVKIFPNTYSDSKGLDDAVDRAAKQCVDASAPTWLVFDGPVTDHVCQFGLQRSAKGSTFHDSVRVFYEVNTASFSNMASSKEVSPSFLEKSLIVSTESEPGDEFWAPLLHKAVRQNKAFSASGNDKTEINTLQMLCEEFLGEIVLFSRHLVGSGSANTRSPFCLAAQFIALVGQLLTVVDCHTADAVERIFWFAVTWIYTTEPSSRAWIDFVNQRISNVAATPDSIDNVYVEDDGTWSSWADRKVPETAATFLMTGELSRAEYLIKLFRDAGLDFALVGPAATGKSSLLKAILPQADVKNPLNVDQVRAGLESGSKVVIMEDVHLHLASPLATELARSTVQGNGRSARLFIFVGHSLPSELQSCIPSITVNGLFNGADIRRIFSDFGDAMAAPLTTFVEDAMNSALRSKITLPFVTQLYHLLAECERARMSDLPFLLATLIGPQLANATEKECFEAILRSTMRQESVSSSVTGHVLIPSGTSKKLNLLPIEEAGRQQLDSSMSDGVETAVVAPAVSSVIATLLRPMGHCVFVGSRGQLQMQTAQAAAKVTKMAFLCYNSTGKAIGEVVANLTVPTLVCMSNTGMLSEAEWIELSFLMRHSKNLHAVVAVETVRDIPLSARSSILGSSLPLLAEVFASKENLVTLASFTTDDASLLATALSCIQQQKNIAPADFIATARNFAEMRSVETDQINGLVDTNLQYLKFATSLYNEAKGRPIISATERDYEMDPEQPLRAFEGALKYSEFPEGRVRMVLRMNTDSEGNITDLASSAVFISTPAEDMFFVPQNAGGLCRCRFEGNNQFTIQAGPLDFKLTLSSVEGQAKMCGTFSDGTQNLGECDTAEVIAIYALSKKWMRYGAMEGEVQEPEKPYEQLCQPPVLPSAGALNITPDELDRYYGKAANVMKSTANVFEAELKQAIIREQKLTGVAIAASLVLPLASLPYNERQAAVEVLQSHPDLEGITIPHPHSAAVAASVLLGESEESLVEWLALQQQLGLPYGTAARDHALIIKQFVHGTDSHHTQLAVVDPAESLGTWLGKMAQVAQVASMHATEVTEEAPRRGDMVVITGVNESTLAGVIQRTSAWTKVTKTLLLATSPFLGLRMHCPIIDATMSIASLQCELFGSLTSPPPGTPAFAQQLSAVARAKETAQRLQTAGLNLRSFCAEQVRSIEEAEGDKALAFVAFTENRIKDILEEVTEAQEAKNAEAEGATKPNAKAAKENEGHVPLAERAAVLVHETYCLLPALRPEAALTLPAIKALCDIALATQPKSERQTIVECFSKTFVGLVVQGLFEEDRLIFCAALGAKMMEVAGTLAPGALASLLSAVRRTDVGEHLKFEDRQEKATAAAKAAAAKHKEREDSAGKTHGAKKATKTRVIHSADTDRPVPEMKPKYSFLTTQQWVRILALSQSRAVFKSLPANMHELEGKLAGNREAKWRDWLSSPFGAIPSYEKDPALTAFDRLALVFAARPDRTVIGLLNFVSEVFGTDFVDPFGPTDTPEALVSICEQTSNSAPFVMLTHSREEDALVDIAVAMRAVSIGKQKAEGKEDTKGKKGEKGTTLQCLNALLSTDAHSATSDEVMSVVDQACEVGDWVAITNAQSLTAVLLEQVLRRSAGVGSESTTRIVLVSQVGLTLPSALANLLVASTTRRLVVCRAKSVQATMSRHYSTVGSEALQALDQGPLWGSMLFVVSYLSAIIEQRQRYTEVGGFRSVTQALQADSDLNAAVTAMVKFSKTSEVPWDEVRELLSSLLGNVADPTDQELIRCYVDWLVHPDVVTEGGTQLGSSLQLPRETNETAHRSAIEGLAVLDSADAVGMHSNAERTLQELEAARMMTTLEGLTLPATQALATLQTKAQELRALLPAWETNDLAMLQSEATSDALSQFLYSEVSELVASSRIIADDLQSVLNAPHSSHIRPDLVQALTTWGAPSTWTGHTDLRATLGGDSISQVIKTMQEQHEQLRLWAHKGRPNTLNLQLIRNPKHLVSAILQDVCAENGWFVECYDASFEMVRPDAVVGAYPTRNLREGLLLSGVKLEGGQLDSRGQLIEAVDLYSNWWKETEFALSHIVVKCVKRGAATMSVGGQGLSLLAKNRRTSAVEFSRNSQTINKTRPSSASGATAAPLRPDSTQRRSSNVPTSRNLLDYTYHTPLYGASRTSGQFMGYVRVPTQMEPNHWVLRGASMVASPGYPSS